MTAEQGIYDVEINGRQLRVEASKDGRLTVQGYHYEPTVTNRLGRDNSFLVQVNDYQFRVDYNDGRLYLDGREVDFSYRVSIPKLKRTSGRSKHKQGKIEATIPGTIVDILVNQGDQVVVGQPLLYLEAMKMRNEIRSPIEGVVEGMYVTVGQKVTKNHTLVVVEPNED